MEPLYQFRVRRGWFGVAVLQQLFEVNVYAGQQIVHERKVYRWRDVKYDACPAAWEPKEGEE